MTTVAIRVDASVQIGLGHLARCMALASTLRANDTEIVFITRALGLDADALIGAAGFPHRRLPAPREGVTAFAVGGEPQHAAWAGVQWQLDAEQTAAALAGHRPSWIVVDHYAFDARWHRAIAAATGAKICAIDDLADRPLSVALLVDQNVAADHRAKYAAAGIGKARVLGGPRYALLAARYATAARYLFRHPVRSIGIFMGGTDPHRLSARVLHACREIAGFKGLIEIATTRFNPERDALAAACERLGPARLIVDEPDLSAFYARHDLQIGAAGGAMWERCCIGAPTIAVAFAANQRLVLDELGRTGAVEPLPSLDPIDIGRAVQRMLKAPEVRQRLAERARTLVDGRGAQRVACALLAETLTLVAATPADAELAYQWRNDERTRRYFRNPAPIARETHARWWAQTLANDRSALLAARCGNTTVGFVRLDHLGSGSAEISLYLDPELTGLGLGTAALRAVQRWIDHRSDIRTIVAHVLPQNTASIHAFTAAGFARSGDTAWEWERIE